MTMRDLIPNIAQSLIDTYARVIDTGRPETFEIHVPELLRTFEVRARRHRDQQFTALFLEISGRKQAEARREAMTELGERLRDVRDKAEIGGVAADILGRILGLSHAGYGVVDAGRETILVERGWTAPGLAPIDGPHQFRDYGSYIEDLKAGETVIIADVAGDPRTSRDAAALTAIDARALLNVPVMEQGRFVGLIYAVKATPHAWTAEEKAFVRNVADRTRAAIARVEAEDRQRTLNHELSHRMKNMLAMVQSIATQTMRNAGDMETAKNVLANRLIALSKSHDLLLGGSLDSTSMQALVENALDLHTDRIGRFAIYGAELSVGARAAMSLSLILHELATNAAKYGSLSTHDGHVSIRWEVLDDATVRLRWSESGGPEVTPPSRTGFGTRLIGRGLAGNFGGAVTLDYPVTGVVCTIVASVDGLKAEDAPAAVA